MSKAYDLIEWQFLEDMMRKLGFCDEWVHRVMYCVSTVCYFILHEEKELGPVIPERGLRQGHPLSPYLFIICAEGLSLLLQTKENEGFLHGCSVARGAPKVSHLFFVDDCFLFFKATMAESSIIKEFLIQYEIASGQ